MSSGPRSRRHSPAVYRRRRLFVVIVLLAIAAGIVWLLIAQPWQAWATQTDAGPSEVHETTSPTVTSTVTPTPSTTPTETPAEAASPTPSGTATADATGTAKPCVTRAIVVEAVTDASSYASGQNPQLSIRLTNSGEVDCTLNVGTSTQAFVITSGSDTWWRSTDCQTEPSDMIVTLAAGQSVSSSAPVPWDRTRSSVSTCGDANRQVAAGGGASYHLSVEIGGILSSQSAQFLLY